MPQMIYHAAYPIKTDSVSGSKIRPQKMLNAFQELGYEVFAITGYARERKQRLRLLKRKLKQGEKFDFLYSENATIPFALTEKSHLPPHPILDVCLFSLCKRHTIPAGVFYRDIYWVFPEYEKTCGKVLATLMRQVYKYELLVYRRFMKHIFVPSLEMTKYCPLLRAAPAISTLPPGGISISSEPQNSRLSILYIGGLDAHYDIKEMVEGVKRTPNVDLYICADKQRWEKNRDRLDVANYMNIKPVHLRGPELDRLYQKIDIGAVVVQPNLYFSFAQPIKFYEYIGQGKPVLVSPGLIISKYVKEHGIGWVVDNDRKSITAQINALLENPDEIERAKTQVKKVQSDNTWLARAQTVQKILQN